MNRLTMKIQRIWCVLLLIAAPSAGSALSIDDISDKSKPVWTDLSVTSSHHYLLSTLFGTPSNYLCSLAQTGYEQYSNFMAQDQDDLEGVAYRVKTDERSCQRNDKAEGFKVLARQSSPDEQLVVTRWPYASEQIMGVVQVKLDEEATDTNPFGLMEMNVTALSENNEEATFVFRLKSEDAGDGQVRVRMAMWLDQQIVDNEIDLNVKSQFYGGGLMHDGERNIGSGNIIWKLFDSRLVSSPIGNSFPDGIPFGFRAVNVAYDESYLKYKVTADFYGAPWGNDYGPYQYDEGTFCVARDASWTYVDKFGIYDSAGNQNTAEFDAKYTNADGEQFDLEVRGMDFATANVCRAWADGSVITLGDGESCSGVSTGIAGGSLRNIEPPSLSEITRVSDGEKFLVRHLLTRNVYKQLDAGASECSALDLPEIEPLPNHLFFTKETQQDFAAPAVGAVIKNAYENRANEDQELAGKMFNPLEDSDGDGVLNYLDAFPEDDTKSKDLDGDGIDDAKDNSDDRINYDYSDFYFPNKVEYMSPSQAETSDNS
jgi:hypothetical protein